MFAQNLIDNFKENNIHQLARDVSDKKLLTASPQVMDQLTKEKAYIAIAQPVLLYITAHPGISDGAKNLWLFLYMETSRFENFTVRFTPTDLAEALTVAERTIQRRLRELEDERLLVRGERYADGRQLVNNLTITLPHEVADRMLKYIPNRKKQSIPMRTRQPSRYKTSPDKSKVDQHNRDEKQNIPTEDAPTKTCVNKSRPKLKDIVSGKVKLDRQYIVDSLKIPDNTVTGEGDKNVIQNNNKAVNNIINNTQTPNLSQRRNKRINSHIRNLSLLKNNVNQEKPSLCNYEESHITVPEKAILKVKNRLESYDFHGLQLEQLTTEVVFSVYHTKTWHCEKAKAINCCLMLIRQNRWRTPSGFRH